MGGPVGARTESGGLTAQVWATAGRERRLCSGYVSKVGQRTDYFLQGHTDRWPLNVKLCSTSLREAQIKAGRCQGTNAHAQRVGVGTAFAGATGQHPQTIYGTLSVTRHSSARNSGDGCPVHTCGDRLVSLYPAAVLVMQSPARGLSVGRARGRNRGKSRVP